MDRQRKHQVFLIVVAGLVVTILLLPPASFGSSCVPEASPPSDREALAASELAFEGVALPGPSFEDGLLFSPASFRVTKNLKGATRRVIRVRTDHQSYGGGVIASTSGGLIAPKIGEKWRIYGEIDGRERKRGAHRARGYLPPLYAGGCDERTRRIAPAKQTAALTFSEMPDWTAVERLVRSLVMLLLRN